MELKYKRILLKLSGEALAGNKEMGIDFEKVLEAFVASPGPSSSATRIPVGTVRRCRGSDLIGIPWESVEVLARAR